MVKVEGLMNQFNTVMNNFMKEGSDPEQLQQAVKTLESATMLVAENQLAGYLDDFSDKIQNLNNRVSLIQNDVSLNEGDRKSETLLEVNRTVQDLSAQLFSLMEKPTSSSQLDLVSSLAIQVQSLDQNDTTAFKAFGDWISANGTPIADLNWSSEDLMKLAPHLSTLNFTDFNFADAEKNGFPVDEFITSCHSVRELIFHGNEFTQDLKNSFQSLTSVETIQMKRCEIVGDFPEFSRFPNLKSLLLQEGTSDSNELDLSNCKNLKSLKLFGIADLAGPVLLPKSGSLEELKMNFLPSFNAELDLGDCTQLKKLSLNLLRSFNHTLDLSQSENLTSVKVEYCDKWEGELFLPHRCPLETLDLRDARTFSGDLSAIENYPSLKRVNLTNCRQFSAGIDFSKLENLTHVSLKNCFSYTERADFSQASRLEKLDVVKIGGKVKYPKHLGPRVPLK